MPAMKRLLLIPFLLMILITSCEESKKEANKNTTSETLKGKPDKKEFEEFLANFKPAKFPMIYSQYDPYPSKFPILNHEFFPFYLPESQGPITPYGYVKLNDSKIALIFFYHSEDYLVGIRTFTNDGIKIDEKQITLGYCGADLCMTCDEETMVNSDLSFSCRYSYYITDCQGDSSLLENESITRKGKVLSTGKIFIGKEVNKQFVKPRKMPVDTSSK